MNHENRYAKVLVALLLVALLCGTAALKVLYIGVRQIPVGELGDHKIVFCWTWSSPGSLITNDGREGYYRIYSPDGEKVFERFTKTYASDLVLTSETEVEFQLDTVTSVFWPPRE